MLSLPQTEGVPTSAEMVSGDMSREDDDEEEEDEDDERLLDLSPRPTPVRSDPSPDSENNGLLALDVSHLRMFVVTDYRGEKERTLACTRVSSIVVHE